MAESGDDKAKQLADLLTGEGVPSRVELRQLRAERITKREAKKPPIMQRGQCCGLG